MPTKPINPVQIEYIPEAKTPRQMCAELGIDYKTYYNNRDKLTIGTAGRVRIKGRVVEPGRKVIIVDDKYEKFAERYRKA